MKRWADCYSQNTSEKFTTAWNQLMEDYSDQEQLINYLKDEWWPYRKEFVTCYTDLYMHFGNRWVKKLYYVKHIGQLARL